MRAFFQRFNQVFPVVQRLWNPHTRHAPWEHYMFRLAFATVLYLNTPSSLAVQSQPFPNGLARFFDLGFFGEPSIYGPLYLVFSLALIPYVLGVGLPLVLPLLFFVSAGSETLLNSQGYIRHTKQIVDMILLGQTFVYLAKPIFGHYKSQPPGGMNWHDAAAFASRQMIAAAYVVSAYSKWRRSSGEWLANSPLFASEIIKTHDQNYYTHLEPPLGTGDSIAQWMVANYELVAVGFGMGFLLELTALLLLLNRGTAFFYGVAIIAFHRSVEVIMGLTFPLNEQVCLIFLVNPIFWLVTGALWLKNRNKTATPRLPRSKTKHRAGVKGDPHQ
ncbi:MAG: hypothetical protein ACFCU3_06570 [Verrucomicrobiales bacterium]